MGGTEEAGKVATATVAAMQSAPLAIALLLVNLGFIAFNGYILSAVAKNANERNKTQMDLIARLADDVRDCNQSGHRSSNRSPLFLPPSTEVPIKFNLHGAAK
jgi:hypothetical protein